MRAQCVGVGAVTLVLLGSFSSVSSGALVSVSDPSGLAAQAEFSLVNATTLQVRLRNTSTGVPQGFSNSDQLLTGVSWDFGLVGSRAGEASITSGTVVIGASSQSVNFSGGALGPGADVSGEWGFGNGGSGLAFTNFISALQAGSTPFGGTNRDGPSNLSGPQGGLVASPAIIPVGGLGAIQNEIVATLTLSQPLNNLDFITANQVRFEFGSDAAFLTVPGPGSAALLALGGLFALRRRR